MIGVDEELKRTGGQHKEARREEVDEWGREERKEREERQEGGRE